MSFLIDPYRIYGVCEKCTCSTDLDDDLVLIKTNDGRIICDECVEADNYADSV